MQQTDESGETPSRSDRLRAFILASPWVTISILLHVIVLCLMAVIVLREKAEERVALPIGIAIRQPLVEPNLPPPEPPQFNRERMLAPQFESKKGAPNGDVEFLEPDKKEARKGEVTPDATDPTLPPGLLNPDPFVLNTLPSGTTGGTPIGLHGPGHPGRGTSAFSGRHLGGGGPGGGGPGEGGDGRLRGPPERIDTVATMAALQWLANHQSPDGRWDCDGFDAQCRKNSCDGHGEATYDVGITGLSLLCFLGAGFTHQEGPFKKTVKEGLLWLKSVQDDDGIFGGRNCSHYQYNTACAALAMAEAYGMTGAAPFREPAQKGVAWVLRSQNPYRAWRYGAADGDNDSSVTGWMTMVLKSAVMAGIDVDHVALDNAANFIDEMTDPGNGRCGYQQKGGLPARVQGPAMEKFPAQNSESLTSVGILVRIFDGHTPGSDDKIMKGADLLAAQLPKWEPQSIDFYYWYYGTLAMFQVGGKHWERWNEALKQTILAHQNLDAKRDEYGSWDPVDPWSQEGGRVYATALNALCTEVYYRYPRVFGMNRDGATKPK